MKTHILVLLSLFALAAGLRGEERKPPRYWMYVLPTLGEGAWDHPLGLSSTGVAIGSSGLPSGGPSAAVTWTGGMLRRLAMANNSQSCGAISINAAGGIAGSCGYTSGFNRAVVWPHPRAAAVELDSPAGLSTQAWSVNSLGATVGSYMTIANQRRPALWQDGVMVPLGWYGFQDEIAFGINDRGDIVGGGGTPQLGGHALRWVNGTPQPIDGMGTAYAVNTAGQVIGITQTGRPAIWQAGEIRQVSSIIGETMAINDHGWVVGWLLSPGPSLDEAYVFDGDRAYFLHTLIVNHNPFDVLWEARGINNRGEIVGMGVINGRTRGFLLKPAP